MSEVDPGVSEIKETIVDVRQLEEPMEGATKATGKRTVEQVLEDLKHIDVHCIEDIDKHLWDRQLVGSGGRSGFYQVPEVMRRRAGSEEAALYDPKHINFSKIGELFRKYKGGDDQTRSQVKHYCYHLRSYARTYGIKEIESLILQVCNDFESSTSGDSLGSPEMLGNIFLRDLFQRSGNNKLSARNDPECAHLWVSELRADLLLLENQIPLFRWTSSQTMRDREYPTTKSLNDGQFYLSIISYFEDFIPSINSKEVVELVHKRSDYRFHHLLNLIHDMMLPTCHPLVSFRCSKDAAPSTSRHYFPRIFQIPEEKGPSMKPFPSATGLQHAGIKFKPVHKAGFVVEFKRGVLKLPHLRITKCTKKILMNLIAWEKCHLLASKYFINYAIFMDHLINTSKDVEILVQSGVFEHCLATDEEVATLFNGLAHDLVYMKDDPYNERYDIFPKLSLDINKYCKSRRNVWWANLMQDYFKSPWSVISLIAALFLILFTLTQTFFSAYSYFRPPK